MQELMLPSHRARLRSSDSLRFWRNRAYQQDIQQACCGDYGHNAEWKQVAAGHGLQLAGHDSAEHSANAVDADNDTENLAQ